MNGELLAIFFGLAAAVGWGAGDFSGGLATKRNNVFAVILFSQISSIFMLIGLALLRGEPMPASGDLLIGSTAGLVGAAGLVALYRALATRHMGLVAPLTAVVAAALPVLVAAFTEGLPAPRHMVGFLLALAGVWLIAREGKSGARYRLRDLALPLFAGFTFGTFFILIDQVSDRAVYWPLVAARSASITLILLLVLAWRGRRESWQVGGWRQWALIVLIGLLETAGNVFFALATAAGRLDIASVLASLYPAVTVLLAWMVLQERLALRQWLGVVASLLAIVFIAG